MGLIAIIVVGREHKLEVALQISDEAKLRRYESRGKTRDQFAQAVFLLNGGAAVSTLAFLQATMLHVKELVRPTAFTLLIFCLGLVSSSLLAFIRPFVSLSFEQKNKRRYHILHGLEIAFGLLPILSFAVGCMYLALAVARLG